MAEDGLTPVLEDGLTPVLEDGFTPIVEDSPVDPVEAFAALPRAVSQLAHEAGLISTADQYFTPKQKKVGILESSAVTVHPFQQDIGELIPEPGPTQPLVAKNVLDTAMKKDPAYYEAEAERGVELGQAAAKAKEQQAEAVTKLTSMASQADRLEAAGQRALQSKSAMARELGRSQLAMADEMRADMGRIAAGTTSGSAVQDLAVSTVMELGKQVGRLQNARQTWKLRAAQNRSDGFFSDLYDGFRYSEGPVTAFDVSRAVHAAGADAPWYVASLDRAAYNAMEFLYGTDAAETTRTILDGADEILLDPANLVSFAKVLPRGAEAARLAGWKRSAAMFADIQEQVAKDPQLAAALLKAKANPKMQPAASYAEALEREQKSLMTVARVPVERVPGVRPLAVYAARQMGKAADAVNSIPAVKKAQEQVNAMFGTKLGLGPWAEEMEGMAYVIRKRAEGAKAAAFERFLADTQTEAGEIARYDRAAKRVSDETRSLILETKGDETAMKVAADQALADGRITPVQAQKLHEFADRNATRLAKETDAATGIGVEEFQALKGMGYMHHRQTKDALEWLAKEFPEEEPAKRLSSLLSRLTGGSKDPGFTLKRILDMPAVEANELMRVKAGMPVDLFHTSPEVADYARELSHIDAMSHAQAARAFKEVFGMPAPIIQRGAAPAPAYIVRSMAETKKATAASRKLVYDGIEADWPRFWGGVLAGEQASRLGRQAKAVGAKLSRTSRKVFDLHAELEAMETRFGVSGVVVRDALDLGAVKERIARLKAQLLGEVWSDPVRAWEAAQGKAGAVERAVSRRPTAAEIDKLAAKANELESKIAAAIDDVVPRAHVSDRAVVDAVHDIFMLEAAPNLEKMIKAEARVMRKAGKLGVEAPTDLRQQYAIQHWATLPKTGLEAVERAIYRIERRMGRAMTEVTEQSRQFEELVRAQAQASGDSLEAMYELADMGNKTARRALREAKEAARRQLGLRPRGPDGKLVPSLDEQIARAGSAYEQAAERLEALRVVPDKWKVIQGGPMKGTAFPPEVWEAANKLNKITDPSTIEHGLAVLGKMNRWWSAWQLLPTPGYHTRNEINNVISLVEEGVVDPRWYGVGLALQALDPGQLTGFVKRGVGLDQISGELRSFNVLSGSVTEDLMKAEDLGGRMAQRGRGIQRAKLLPRELAEQVRLAYQQEGVKGVVQAIVPFASGNAERSIGLKLGMLTGQTFEEHARATLYAYKRLAEGLSPTDALLAVKRVLFDQLELTEIERRVLKPLIPFYGWFRSSIPKQTAQTLKQPSRVSHLARFKASVESRAQADENERAQAEGRKPRMLVPEEMLEDWQRKGGAVRRTAMDQGGFSDISLMSGFHAIFDMDKIMGFRRFAEEAAGATSPFIKIAAGMFTGYDLFRPQSGKLRPIAGLESQMGDQLGVEAPRTEFLGSEVNPYVRFAGEAFPQAGNINRLNPGNRFGLQATADRPALAPRTGLVPFAPLAQSRAKMDTDQEQRELGYLGLPRTYRVDTGKKAEQVARQYKQVISELKGKARSAAKTGNTSDQDRLVSEAIRVGAEFKAQLARWEAAGVSIGAAKKLMATGDDIGLSPLDVVRGSAPLQGTMPKPPPKPGAL